MQMRSQTAFAGILSALLTVASGPAAPADLHAFWDDRCAECHGHAAQFARNHLKLKDGRLVGSRASRDVCQFLASHGAGPEMAQPLCAMLAAQAATPSLFKQKCAGCHQTAADLARASLVLEAGVLKGKANGKPLAGFLVSHGAVTAEEEARLVATLTRVLTEVGATAGK